MNSNMDLKQHHECVQRAIALGRANDPAALPELTRLLKKQMYQHAGKRLISLYPKDLSCLDALLKQKLAFLARPEG